MCDIPCSLDIPHFILFSAGVNPIHGHNNHTLHKKIFLSFFEAPKLSHISHVGVHLITPARPNTSTTQKQKQKTKSLPLLSPLPSLTSLP